MNGQALARTHRGSHRPKRLTRKQRGTHAEAKPYSLRPGTLNRHLRRAIESIVRTESDLDTALAQKLGDEIVMLPLAKEILKQRTAAIAAEAEKRKSLYARVREKFGDKAMQVLGIDPAAALESEAARG